MENSTFIYALVGPRDSCCRYVGKSDNPYKRYQRHLVERDKTHKERWIRRLARRGIVPVLQILEQCDKSVWKSRERDWISFYNKIGCKLTNISKGGDYIPMEGKHHTDETKRKLSESLKKIFATQGSWNKGRHPSDETKKKIGNAFRGRKLSKEHKQKISEGGIGRVFSEETKEKISQSNLGKHLSDEHKERLRESHLGKPTWSKGVKFSDEYRKKLSIAQKGKHSGPAPWNLGRHVSEETRKKLSVIHKGQVPWCKGLSLSEETRAKMRLSSGMRGKHLSEETIMKMNETRRKNQLLKNSLVLV